MGVNGVASDKAASEETPLINALKEGQRLVISVNNAPQGALEHDLDSRSATPRLTSINVWWEGLLRSQQPQSNYPP